MADFVYPPFEPEPDPAPLSPVVPLNPPMVGEASPFDHVDAQNRDIILEAIRAWARGALRTWTGAWQAYLIQWLEESQTWLNGFGDEVERYVEASITEQNEWTTDYVTTEVAAARAYVDAEVAESRAYVDAETAAARAYVDAAVLSIINSTIEVSDPVVATLLNDTDTNTSGYVRRGTGIIVTGEGVDPTGVTSSQTAILALKAIAITYGARLIFPPGDYLVESLGVFGPLSAIAGTGVTAPRFAAGGVSKPRVRIIQADTATTPLITVNGGGVSIDNVELLANTATLEVNQPPLLYVQDGFELKMSNVRLKNHKGVAFKVKRANNTHIQDFHFVDCGGATVAPFVVMSPAVSEAIGETNTFDIDSLTIERNTAGPLMDIAYGGPSSGPSTGITAQDGYYAEFVRIGQFHGEGTANTTDALVRIGNVGGLWIGQFWCFNGGTGYVVSHDQNSVRNPANTTLMGGVYIGGGFIVGRSDSTNPSLIHLIAGNDFSIGSTRCLRYSTAGITIDSTYGIDLSIDPSTRFAGTPYVDNRTGTPANGKSWNYPGPANARALAVGGTTVQNPLANINGAAATARRLAFSSADLSRWIMQANSTAEVGSNAGSDFELQARNDTGGNIGTALSIKRATLDGIFTGTLQIGVKGARPSAAIVGTGAQMYDVNIKRPLWSDGTQWRDSDGTIVP